MGKLNGKIRLLAKLPFRTRINVFIDAQHLANSDYLEVDTNQILLIAVG
jgi:hypothetical protein